MEAEGMHSSKCPRMDKDVPGADLKGVGGPNTWQNASSRIIRGSRVSGGKDRHSKVWTVKGIRDRRVRLSVSTSIQFYDLQDRLGYDQPSKAVDWLIKAAAAAILDLPELEGPLSVPPSLAPPDLAILPERTCGGMQHISQSNSTCSSASDTSKCSLLSLSKSEILLSEKEKKRQSLNKEISHRKLLTASGDISGGAAGAVMVDFNKCFDQKMLPANCTSDYFKQSETFGDSYRIPQFEPSYSSLLCYGSNPHIGMGMMKYNATSSGLNQDIHQFSFMQDQAILAAAAAPCEDSNHNVSMSSDIVGFTRGTLQSNSPHQHYLSHGASLPFFLSATLPIAATGGSSMNNQFPGDFNARLQLFCNEAQMHLELKQERKG